MAAHLVTPVTSPPSQRPDTGSSGARERELRPGPRRLTSRRLSPWLAPLVLSMLVAGCYRSHLLDADDRDADRPDADADAARHDAGEHEPLDAGEDAPPHPPDAEPPGRDAGLPPPAGCRRDFAPEVELAWPTSEITHPRAVHVGSTPLVFEDRAGSPKLAFVSFPPQRTASGCAVPDPRWPGGCFFDFYNEVGGVLRIVDPATGDTQSYPREGELPPLHFVSHLAVDDLDGDGAPELVGLGKHGGTYAFDADATLLWRSSHPPLGELGFRFFNHVMGGAPTTGDLDGDGAPEVVVGDTVLEGRTGELRWRGEDGTGRGTNQWSGPISCVADLDGDGDDEVVAGKTAFDAGGRVLWTTDTPDGFCAVAEIFEEHPGVEVALVAKGWLRVLRATTGEILWKRQLEGWGADTDRSVSGFGGPPSVVDLEDDGEREILVAEAARVGVYRRSCKRKGPRCLASGLAAVYVISDASSSTTGVTAFDFDGDGRRELVHADERRLRVLGRGSRCVRWFARNRSRTLTEYPLVADIDRDGSAEIVVGSNTEASFLEIDGPLSRPGLYVWGDPEGDWGPAGSSWRQHAHATAAGFRVPSAD